MVKGKRSRAEVEYSAEKVMINIINRFSNMFFSLVLAIYVHSSALSVIREVAKPI